MSPIVLQIILVVLPIILPPLIGLVVMLVRRGFESLPSNIRPIIVGIAKTAVIATEQLAHAELDGPGKKQLALELAQKELAHFGINVPTDVLGSIVEEAVVSFKGAPSPFPAASLVKVSRPTQGQVDTKGVAA